MMWQIPHIGTTVFGFRFAMTSSSFAVGFLTAAA
jgi:hypothetical protein